jgi:hypothetical protein
MLTLEIERTEYFPGELVRGRVLYTPNKEQTVTGVYIRFKGYEHSEWQQGKSKDEKDIIYIIIYICTHTHTHTPHHTKHIILLRKYNFVQCEICIFSFVFEKLAFVRR